MGETHTIAMGNITYVKAIDPAEDGDFIFEPGFFIRVTTTGYLRYCPIGNKTDGEAIEKLFTASDIFVDPEMCRKVFEDLSPGSQNEMAEGIYIGHGV